MLQKIKLGLGNLPGYGDHPGTIWIFLMTFMGFCAGIGRSETYDLHPLMWGLIGALVMLLFFGPIYLIGAYQRGDEYLRGKERERATN